MGARIPRKKGQPANSKKHSDLYTDENPKGTIHGLGFKNPAKARQSLVKIKNSNRSHAHKTQAAIAMEQRAREMGKTTEANIYRRFIEQQKKKTKQMNKSEPMDIAMRLLKQDFQNLQSQINLGNEDPRYDKAIGLTYAQTPDAPAQPSINLAQRNPTRTAPKDAFFNTEDPKTLAQRIALIDAHEAIGHGEDPALGYLLNLREYIRENEPHNTELLGQITAGIEAPGITMEELTNEVLNPEVGSNLSQRVRENFAERAGEPGALFGGGTDTMDPDKAMEDMRIAEINRAGLLNAMGVELPPYSTFGKGKPMDIAMRLLKMPPMWYADSEPQAPENIDFTMLQDFGPHPMGYEQTWESDDGVARGIAVPNHNDGTWAISHFEIADDLQGLGAGQKYLERFIDELREDEYPHEEGFHPYDGELKPYDVHVVQVEPHAFGFWDKMVDRGVLHGSHETAWIRENVDGTHYYTHAYDREKMVAKSTQPLYGWLASANTMNPFERSYMLLKSDGFIDNLIKMGREQDAMQMQAMRQFVLDNQNSSDPALREAAEEMYSYLTQLMGYMGSDRTGESPQMPQVAGFNAPLPDTPRPPMADNVEANRPMGVPAEHPMIGKSAIDMAWDMLQKKMRGGGGAVQLAGYPQSRERGDSKDGASLPPRQTTRHQIMREMEQGKREGTFEPPYAIEEDDNIMEQKNKEALAELFGMRPKGRTIGDAM